MPVRNAAKYLQESIESILAQTFQNFELIIIDDGSDDETPAILRQFSKSDTRITITTNTLSQGLSGALNTGIGMSSGRYIARADGDDIALPTRLEEQRDFLEKNPNIAIVGSWYTTFGNNQKNKVIKHPSSPSVIAWKFLSDTFFCHPTVVFRRSILATVPCYQDTACEDFAFFSQIVHKHKGANIKKSLLLYRQHDANYSNDKKAAIAASVRETFANNFLFYGGSSDTAEIFYDFHKNHKLPIKHLGKIVKESIVVARAIAKHYNSNTREKIMLYGHVATHLLVAPMFPILQSSYRYIKKQL